MGDRMQRTFANIFGNKGVVEQIDRKENNWKRLHPNQPKISTGGQGGWAPGKASGGPVRAHSPYIVGERGPELMVPQTNGTIVPNGGGFLPVTNIIKVMLDSREIQRIPFNTTLPINVSVVGV
jgi:hypothetical protein